MRQDTVPASFIVGKGSHGKYEPVCLIHLGFCGKVRAYKKVGEKKLYGACGKVKKAKVK